MALHGTAPHAGIGRAVGAEGGRALRDAHLIDDETVAKMGHPGDESI